MQKALSLPFRFCNICLIIYIFSLFRSYLCYLYLSGKLAEGTYVFIILRFNFTFFTLPGAPVLSPPKMNESIAHKVLILRQTPTDRERQRRGAGRGTGRLLLKHARISH